MALCFWFGFRLYLQHHISSISTIVIVLMSVMMLAFSISQTAGPIIAATKAASAAADFFAVIDAPSKYILSSTTVSGHLGRSNSLFTKMPQESLDKLRTLIIQMSQSLWIFKLPDQAILIYWQSQ